MARDAQTTERPSCLDLLNSIWVTESAAAVFLGTWADATPNAELADTLLRFVTARERSHSDVFSRRIAELGHTPCPNPESPQAAEMLAKLADPGIGDLEKVSCLDPKEADPFAETRRYVAEGEFDSITKSLLDWYLEEDTDSLRRLRAAFERVRG